ncbi:hypothetical protein STCU_00565 [Strigomonas culicis]|uniref:Uncharacterized protein n=1 Tax=Strigomonas culicis TaxID=28005 RepID=S9WKF6_9TRYP|nr:hypothetical protein STCU_00565 [Strigomonas culicis]|eukprot:EPY36470.1 hypothetical protein STCU_00565 [Strigomonas culicis]
MHFFFRHLTYCPPRGPFRHYSALTFVERAKRRFGAREDEGEARADDGLAADPYRGATLGGLDGEHSMANEDEEQHQRHELCQAISIPSVLALMAKYYACEHLSNWPLLYVHADVHRIDVERKLNELNSTAAKS